jgi:hypothetical protein
MASGFASPASWDWFPNRTLRTLLMKTRIVAIFLLVVGGYANCKAAPELPGIFVSVLAEVKAGTSIPVLLPTELPRPFRDAKHAIVGKISANKYRITLYYEQDIGDARFAASFAAEKNASYSPRELSNVREVKLSGGVVGFFRPVSCGGSCAPANLWWEQGAVLYQIQLKLPSTLLENEQLGTIAAVADSAIQPGPR